MKFVSQKLNMKTDLQFNLLLEDIINVTRRYEKEREKRGDQYNLFKVIHMTSNETSVHSAFISDLLNPRGLHGMGSEFLKLFIECLPEESKKGIGSFDVDSAIVRIEYYIGEKTNSHGGRLDIIVLSRGQAIILENKIYAEDQDNQMIRYYNYAEENYRNNYSLLYLSLDGNVHDEDVTAHNKDYNLSINEDFFTISYKETIWEWLHLCQDKARNASNTLLEGGISHYINLIKILTHKDNTKMKEAKDIANILVSNQDAVRNLGTIEKAICHQAKIELQRKFWKELIHQVQNDKNLNSYPIEFFISDGTYTNESLENSINNYVDEYLLVGEEPRKYNRKPFGISLPIKTYEGWAIRINVVVNIAISFQVSVEKDGNKLLNQSPDLPYCLRMIRDKKLPSGWKKEDYRIWGTYPNSFNKQINMGKMTDHEYLFFSELPKNVALLVNDLSEVIDNINNMVK